MSEAYFPVESGALGPEENFLSLDDLLMSQEKLPVRVETALPRLGAFFLERGAGAEPDHALPQGTKLELPLWLAKGLFDNKRRILSVELPKIYQEGWRTVFSADANVVDLHKMGPHFYGFGSQLLHFDSPESADISQSLLQAVLRRSNCTCLKLLCKCSPRSTSHSLRRSRSFSCRRCICRSSIHL
ncbi:DNA replication complex GINS protein PSF3 isoform X2 [Meriones unguiculatus]|uniref:DNA replication complex GINS protein PSF3 isoform X2 n=1 Tax=Meriones unguiculatus TaxID=10047 RepID=UPI000B4F10D3|nr:DNA replication complex GINS protein PSF3 isoform X2 [Meriones unguiculatus]